MACLAFDPAKRLVFLDLHGCSAAEALILLPAKIAEALACGCRGILIVYGKSSGDLATAVHRALSASPGETRISLSFDAGAYDVTANGSPFDSALLLLFPSPASSREVRLSGFRPTYGEPVLPLDPSRPNNVHLSFGARLQQRLLPDSTGNTTSQKLVPNGKQRIAKPAELRIPAAWRAPKKQK